MAMPVPCNGFADAEQLTRDCLSEQRGTTTLSVRNKAETTDQDQTRTDQRGLSWQMQTQPLLTGEDSVLLANKSDERGTTEGQDCVPFGIRDAGQ